MPMLRRFLAPSLAIACVLAPSVASARSAHRPTATIEGAIPLYFAPRPAADGSGRVIPGQSTAPVIIEFLSAPTQADLDLLRQHGAVLSLNDDGMPIVRSTFVLADVAASALEPLSKLPNVRRIALDGAPFQPPRPLDYTAAQIQAMDVWRAGPDGLGFTGAGITICDIDSGVDVFHPMFFRADGGALDWVDVDGNGIFSPGIDGIDPDGDGQADVLRVLNTVITTFYDKDPQFGSDDPAYQLGMDWLYADRNGSGAREFGPSAGFTEADPTFGEPLYVPDDVNRNGVLDEGEKLVALGSSKIKAVRFDNKTYQRGKNLIMLPITQDFDHGTGASGVLLGGHRGLTNLVGIAPDAELVMVTQSSGGEEVKATNFCLNQGARVVLHEYAPWVGYPLDGSSPMEQLIDESSAQGVSHINPAGNLSTSDKLYKRSVPAGQQTIVPIEAPKNSPYAPFRFIGVSLLWRDVMRNLTLQFKDPTGFQMELPNAPGAVYTDWHDGLEIYAERTDSSRGTSRVDIYVFGQNANPPPIPAGTWTITVNDPAPPGAPDLALIGYVMDDMSGWGKGIFFPEHASEDHLIGHPGTADHGLAVAAYVGHGFLFGSPGERAPYSGRGYRIDGKKILAISAPDDPITAGFREGEQASGLIYGGTSGASPHVAGAAALLLQAHPDWTGADVHEAIRNGALVDEHVGQAPNDDFGYGKLRIHRSLFGQDPPAGSDPRISIDPVTAYAGVEVSIPIDVSDMDEPATSLVLDADLEYDGTYDQRLVGPSLRLTYTDLGRRILKLRVLDSTGRDATALAIVDVVDKPLDPPAVIVAGGGGCSQSGGSNEYWPIALLGLMATRRGRGRGRQ
ncbi:MAG: S8 family serine peptidase [Polyangiaceae bacterium]|nr:S8 family serine peptidase [Polyangiaceae bacterium]